VVGVFGREFRVVAFEIALSLIALVLGVPASSPREFDRENSFLSEGGRSSD